jgi:hypothetical protein
MGPRALAAMHRANQVARIVNPDVPGTPARDAALLPAGFPVYSFVAATGLAAITNTINIQTPFRGQRLSVIVIRSGATATASAPLMTVFQVGQKPILVTPNPVPLETFSQTAFDTNMLMPPTIPGVVYTLAVALSSALTGTDTLTCIVGLIGSAVL